MKIILILIINLTIFIGGYSKESSINDMIEMYNADIDEANDICMKKNLAYTGHNI